MTERQPRPWTRLLLGYGLAIAALAFTARTLDGSLAELRAFPLQSSMAALAACALLMTCHTLLNREGFVQLCQALDSGIPPAAIRRIWGRSLLAKYIPGGIWQLAGRGLQMRRLGSRNNSAIVSGILEQALSLALCAAIATCAYLLLSGHVFLAAISTFVAIAGLWLCPCLIPQLAQGAALRRSLLLYTAAMPFYLAAYACLATQLPILELCTRLFAGTLAGMAAFIVPGGIGVRESVASLLSINGTASLLPSMIMARILTIGVEILITLASLTRRPQQ